MDDLLCRSFFLEPASCSQRQYEALRAVFVERLSQKEAAQRFGYTYDAFRQLVGQFRSGLLAGHPPPFSRLPAEGGRPQAVPGRCGRSRKSPRLPTPGC